MPIILLFDSVNAAREVAWMLQAEWDGCNGVVLSQFDSPALETAVGLFDALWCWCFENCLLPPFQREELLQSYRQGQRCFSNLNLAGVDLSYQDLTGIHLGGANLTGANLTGTSLQSATLWEANFSNCKLVSANLRSAFLNNATLAGADLSNANLRSAHLGGANLSGADLSNASLRSAFMSNANLSGAILQGANLRAAHLYNVNLQAADLSGAVLYLTFLFEANLSRANLNWRGRVWSQFMGAKLDDASTLDGNDGDVPEARPTLASNIWVMGAIVLFGCLMPLGLWSVTSEQQLSPQEQMKLKAALLEQVRESQQQQRRDWVSK